MFAPIQMQGFEIVESYCSVNPVYQPPEGASLKGLLYVRGELVDPEAGPELEEKEIPLRLDVSTEFMPEEVQHEGRQGGAERFRMLLVIAVNAYDEEALSQRCPYTLEYAAFSDFLAFDLPSEPDERRRALRIVRANGASMMYGCLRRVIQEVTLSTVHPPLILPSVNFAKILDHEPETGEGSEPPASEDE